MKYQLGIALISILIMFVFVYRSISEEQRLGALLSVSGDAVGVQDNALEDRSQTQAEITLVVNKYINALKSRDNNRIEKYLTPQALDQSKRYQPPFELTIVRCEQFETRNVHVISDNRAVVEVQYELKDRTGRLTDDYSSVLLKKNNNVWQVSGMVVNYPDRKNLLTIDFEDLPGSVNQLLNLKQEAQAIADYRLLAQQQAQRQRREIQAYVNNVSDEETHSVDDNPHVAREINGIICK